jgi:CheY-like chemotaxis protein
MIKRTVLLVEDNAQNRYLLTYLLEIRGYAVIAATDGPSAIRVAINSPPDVILLDIQLPMMDGYTVAHAMRQSASLRHVPIIAVTSYAMVGDREKALAAGCNGYIEKPIDPKAFVAQIEEVMAGGVVP